MAAKVETMAFTGERPWHGLGNELSGRSIDESLQESGLIWTVSKEPIKALGKDGWVEVPDRYALMRNTDDRVFDIVGPDYKVVQPRQIVEFFRAYVQAGQATIETLGSLDGGRLVWCLARIGDAYQIGGSEMRPYALIASPYVSKALTVKPTTVRVVCWNTISMALRGSEAEYRHNHRSAWDGEAISRADTVLGLAREKAAEFAEQARILHETYMSWERAKPILQSVVAPSWQPGIRKQDEPRKMRLISEAYTQAPGAEPGTAWGALNALTYYTDHLASRTQDTRLMQAWVGQTANMKEQALTALLAAA